MLRKVKYHPGDLVTDFKWGEGTISAPIPLLPCPVRGAGRLMRPNHPFKFQYMEFRKTMDIDHILDWQPPEVSPTLRHLSLNGHITQEASGHWRPRGKENKQILLEAISPTGSFL